MENEVDYEKILADLEAKKANIEAAISGIKVMLGQAVNISGVSSTSARIPTSISHDTFFNMTVLDAAKKYLSMVAKETKPTLDILKALEKGGIHTTYATLSSQLSRAKTANEVVCPKRGLWGLPEWYA